MEGTECEILVKGGAEHAHRFGVLPDNRQRVEIDITVKEGVSHLGGDFPSGDVQLRLELGRGGFAEIIIPLEVVGEEMVVVVLGLLYRCLEPQVEVDRALACPAERM